jgi:mono/diheme cytochrome c family protein
VKKNDVAAVALLLAGAIAVLGTACGGGGSTEPINVAKTAEGKVSFQGTVHPILMDHCIRCHGESADGELSILSYEAVIKGGKSGGFVVPGDPDGSRLITSVEKTKEPFMPPRIFPALTEDRIQAIRQWISDGAEDN